MLTTICFKYAHSEHFLDWFLDGYGWDGAYHHPPMDLVSLYVDQVGADDLSRERAARHPSMKIYPTIAEALTLGGNKLAVDGVLVIGEHGNYPRNERRQTLYPRYEFFQEIVKVFRASGRSVPVFSDKHLSWKWEWAKEMCDTARSMGFAFMGGSSLPVTWRLPSIEMPTGSAIREAVCVYYGGVDSYDFHALEVIQCMVERRKGGETGVKWLEAYRGERFWTAYKEGVWPRDLLEAALCRSSTLTPSRPGMNHNFPSLDDMRRLVKDPIAYHYEHTDGLRCTMVLFNGLVRDCTFAARLDGSKELFTTHPRSIASSTASARADDSKGTYLSMPPEHPTLAYFFSPQVNCVERMFLTGKPTYPVERTLLATGLNAAGVESLYRKQARVETPYLDVRYGPVKESTFRRT